MQAKRRYGAAWAHMSVEEKRAAIIGTLRRGPASRTRYRPLSRADARALVREAQWRPAQWHTVEIPAGRYTSIAESAFHMVTHGLEMIIIPEGITEIGMWGVLHECYLSGRRPPARPVNRVFVRM